MDSLFGDLETPSLPWKEALRLASRIAPKKTTFPMLQSVQFIVSEDSVILRATDLDRATHVAVDLGPNRPKAFSTPGRYLAPLDKIKAGYALDQIIAPDLGDYPDLPDPGANAFLCPWIQDLQVCGKVMADDNTRLVLNGVVVQAQGLAATDGHRLVYKAHETKVPGEIIVSRGLVELLGAVKGSPEALHLSDDGCRLHAVFPWGWVFGKAVEGSYPNWKQVVPRATSWTVRMPMSEIRDILSKVPRGDKMQLEIVPSGDVFQVQFSRAWADTGVLGPVVVEGDMDRIAVNAEYLREMVSVLPGPWFVWKGNTMAQATTLGEGADIHLLMPLRFPKDA
jgi:DNA polymerase III sliding clamp (beta) subunit (PCNA family)